MSPNDHSAFLLILSCTALAVSLSQAYSQAKRPQPVIVLAPQSQRATTLPISANELARRRVQGIKTVILPLSWKHIEPKRAQFDWKLQDHSLAIVQKSRLGWIASWNMLDKTQLPEWFAGKFDAQYRRCIEHGHEGQEQSPWNPILRQHIARVLGAFGAKYRKTPPNTLLLDLPDLPQNPADKQGHAHSGYWGGDQFAVSNFQAWLFRRYGGSSPLRDAWGEYRNLSTLTPFVREQAPNLTAWRDMTQWYAASQTAWAKFCLQEARKTLPMGRVALRLSLSLSPENAQDILDLIRTSAQIGGAVCFVVPPDEESLVLLELAYSAAKAANSQCRILIDKSSSPLSLAVIGKRLPLEQCAAIIVSASEKRAGIALPKPELPAIGARPQAAILLPPPCVRQDGLLSTLELLSRKYSCHLVDERTIAEGALAETQILILPQRPVLERNTWEHIAFWLKSSGKVLYHTDEKPRIIEGDGVLPDNINPIIEAHTQPLILP